MVWPGVEKVGECEARMRFWENERVRVWKVRVWGMRASENGRMRGPGNEGVRECGGGELTGWRNEGM